jgi:MoaA/NifB/PqqE/SkfB family radical SAM enzyme
MVLNIHWEVTNSCELNCIHCSTKCSTKPFITYSNMESIERQLEKHQDWQ